MVVSVCTVSFDCGLPGATQLCSSSMAQLEEVAAGKGFNECLQALERVVRACFGLGC
jgi:hypothetical protein